jgi:hypothetical protein
LAAVVLVVLVVLPALVIKAAAEVLVDTQEQVVQVQVPG